MSSGRPPLPGLRVGNPDNLARDFAVDSGSSTVFAWARPRHRELRYHTPPHSGPYKLSERTPIQRKKLFGKSTQQPRADNLNTPSYMPKWPFLFKDRVTLQTLRLIGEVRKSGATSLDLSYLQLSTLPEAIGRLSQLKGLNLSNNN